jgi:hypothetical protein
MFTATHKLRYTIVICETLFIVLTPVPGADVLKQQVTQRSLVIAAAIIKLVSSAYAPIFPLHFTSFHSRKAASRDVFIRSP